MHVLFYLSRLEYKVLRDSMFSNDKIITNTRSKLSRLTQVLVQ